MIKKFIQAYMDKHFCLHKWKVHYEMKILDKPEDKIPSGIDQHLICEKCGKIHKLKL